MPTTELNTLESNDESSYDSKNDFEIEKFLKITIKTDIETIEKLYDKYPLLGLRKAILRIMKSTSVLFKIITTSYLFQGIVIVIILFNTVVLALEDPTATTLPYPYPQLELFFVIFYTVEFVMLIIADGVFMSKGSYFRNWWNWLNFLILVSAWLTAFAIFGFSLNALRSIRILRPLRSLSSIPGVRALVVTLLSSMNEILSAFLSLFFFMLLFAIAALQL